MAKKRRHYEAVPKPGPGARAVMYLRYSSDKQKGTTIDKQRHLCGEGIAADGWVTLREYVEPETTAKSDEIAQRPQFAALLDAAARHEFDVVVVECVDRWGREESVFWESLKRLDHAGVYWTTVAGTIFNSTVIKQEGFDLAFAVSIGMAASYSRTVSRKVVAGMKAQTLKGYHHSHFPFGYMRSEPELDERGHVKRRQMIANPETFPKLAIIAELCLKKWGSKRIGEAVGVPPSTVLRVLVNETYVEYAPGCEHGTVITGDGERVEGLHPAAWTRDTWLKIRAVQEEMYGRPRATAQWHRAYPLGGLLLCAACGWQLIARTKVKNASSKRYRYYGCYDHDRPKHPIKQASTRCEVVDDAFGAILRQLAERTDWRAELEAYLEEAPQLPNTVVQQRKALQQRMDALDAQLEVGRVDRQTYIKRMRGYQAELATLPIADNTSGRDAAIEGAVQMIDVGTAWEHATTEQRQEMAALLIQPLGLVWDHQAQSFVGIKPFAEFLPGFRVALEWEHRGAWLWRPGAKCVTRDDEGVTA